MSDQAPPGWYDDPEDPSQLRYFDGIIWSERRVPRRPAAPPAGPVPAGPAPADAGATWPAGPGVDVYGRPVPGAPATAPAPGTATVLPDVPPAPRTRDGQPLASYRRRAAAYLLDVVLLGLLNLLVAGWALWRALSGYVDLVVRAVESGDPERMGQITPEQVAGSIDPYWLGVFMLLTLVTSILYHVLLVGLRGATLGKSLLGLRVRRSALPGPPGVGVAARRYLLPIATSVLTLIPYVGLLGHVVTIADLLWPARDPGRQAIHDKIADTVVVRQH